MSATYKTVADMVSALGGSLPPNFVPANPVDFAQPQVQPASQNRKLDAGRQYETKFLRLDGITFDRRLQQRAEMFDYDWIKEEIDPTLLALAHTDEEKATEISTLRDHVEIWNVGGTMYCVDGFSRCEAHRLKGYVYIEADVTRGTFREARGRSFVVNQHGKRLTEEDNRHKLRSALEHYQEELMGGTMSLNAFCAATNFNIAFVSKQLDQMGVELPGEVTVTRTRTNKDGQVTTSTYVMKTSGIGRSKGSGKGSNGGSNGTHGDSELPDLDALFGFSDSGDDVAADSSTGTSYGSAGTNGNNGTNGTSGSKPGRSAQVVEGYKPASFQDIGMDEGAIYGDVLPPAGHESSIDTEQVIYVPAWGVDELRDLIMTYGSVKLQEALARYL